MNQLAAVKIRANVGTFAANMYAENSSLYKCQWRPQNDHRHMMLFKVHLHLSDVIVGIFIDGNSQPVCQQHSSNMSICALYSVTC